MKLKVKLSIAVLAIIFSYEILLNIFHHYDFKQEKINERNKRRQMAPMTLRDEANSWLRNNYPQFTKQVPLPLKGSTLQHKPIGLFGNLLFQFAAVYELSQYHQRQLYIDERMAKELSNVMQLKDLKSELRPFSTSLHKPKTNNCIKIPLFNRFHSSYYNQSQDLHICTNAHFESWKYFQHKEAEIRHLYTLLPELKIKALSIIDDILSLDRKQRRTTTVVGVHVRRGDKVKFRVPSTRYFQKAFRYFETNYNNVHFILVSNGMEWSKTYLSRPNLTFTSNHYNIDFAILTLCDHVIMSVGTFGWWGAWLANGETVYFTAKSWYTIDHFPPYWIPLSDD